MLNVLFPNVCRSTNEITHLKKKLKFTRHVSTLQNAILSENEFVIILKLNIYY